MTNYEKIKSMSAREMAVVMDKYIDCDYCPMADECFSSGNICKSVFLEWLNKEEEADE